MVKCQYSLLLPAQNGSMVSRQRATIADVACYRYIAHAPEYAQVRAWLARIAALPGFVPMATTRVGRVGQ